MFVTCLPVVHRSCPWLVPNQHQDSTLLAR